ncbi:SMP-30/gluconolactonase/LRE family protein [Runella slithyformis]|uniref:SMP-30/Gluconolaconase/LRE-like region-containing protein n=1 Tax=Runella slithyformis (strain ATCC 29530 / DSM 19594 / LMG 11500 / NCIMB 11436 / LSU 4) TaxID=761193 RepID=A0A7U3ZG87_RUNSL|nr:SMP-30/gluconolactonase/LRE family protein [Runella slithyformis]AEI46647.1 SMP-30/Gluconolaconase/LRE-like region-containing protein [Runella slithyformis DSM 19594]
MKSLRYPCIAFCLGALPVFPFVSQAQTSDFSPEHEFTQNCEGPSVDSEGTVYAVNYIMDGTIAQIPRRNKASIFLTLPKGSTGNGIRFGNASTFYVADFTGHNILKVDLTNKQVSVHCNEPKMNQPNDLAITQKGHIFCSDPNWKEGTGQVWHVSPEGKARIVAANMGTTNGIDISPDEKTLYVNESVQRNVWAFDLADDGTLSNKRLVYQFIDGGMDGMRCDAKGNLYITRHGKGEVAVVSPEGKVIKTIKTKGKSVSNICFGGKKGRTCYITLQDRGCLETFQADSPGREWVMMKAFMEKK